jgi:uncharacterized protein YdiU (UPF0061 family)
MWQHHFAELAPLPGSLETPLALRYHGHQFGQYNPFLGDGRGFLLAQLVEGDTGRLLDLGTKGSGQTPYSRGGDGRLTLKGGVREVLATEMLEALGVPTSKSFSLFETGERLMRGDEPSPTRSSVLVRLSHSHVRFGTFQRLAHERDLDATRRLLDHVVRHYEPDLCDEPELPSAWFGRVVEKMADLAASFEVAGFVHGVLNTDNMNVTGESFDYGPYRFLTRYAPEHTAAYFDQAGLYAFGRQAAAFRWNLARLAEALRLAFPGVAYTARLDAFEPAYDEACARRFVARLGLRARDAAKDGALRASAVDFLRSSEVTGDRFFFDWAGGAAAERRALTGPAARHYDVPTLRAFRDQLEAYEPSCVACASAPYRDRAAPPSLHYDVLESIWEAIAERDDWAPFERMVSDLRELGAQTATDPGTRYHRRS